MIGGEFEINPDAPKSVLDSQKDIYYYSSGRAALYQILKSVNDIRKHIWLPDYLCSTILRSVETACFSYSFYKLNGSLEVDLGNLAGSGFQDKDIILLINYFGLQHLQGISTRIKALWPSSVIIEDDVQAFFEFKENPNPNADYRYTSLRKTFPITDGAPVYTKHQMPQVVGSNSFAYIKLTAAYMKFNRHMLPSDEAYLSCFRKADAMIDENLDSVMSEESKAYYASIDFAAVKQKRRSNADFILSNLSRLGIQTILPIYDDATPLFVPVWLEKRDEIRSRLFEKDIFCPVHWPMDGYELEKGREMLNHELSLICDQRYSIEEIKKMFEILH